MDKLSRDASVVGYGSISPPVNGDAGLTVSAIGRDVIGVLSNLENNSVPLFPNAGHEWVVAGHTPRLLNGRAGGQKFDQ